MWHLHFDYKYAYGTNLVNVTVILVCERSSEMKRAVILSNPRTATQKTNADRMTRRFSLTPSPMISQVSPPVGGTNEMSYISDIRY